MPVPIRVHMFGWRRASDCAQRRKNGQPAQTTTGVDSSSSSQERVQAVSPSMPWPAMASAATATVNGSVHQKR